MSTPSLAELRDFLKVREGDLKVKESLLQESTQNLDNLKRTYKSDEVTSLEAEKKKAYTALEHSETDIADVRPKYEAALAASEVPAPPELKEAISSTKKRIDDLTQESSKAEKEVHEISQMYLDAYESNEKLVAALGSRIGSLQVALNEKIRATNSTIIGENGEPLPHPNEALATLETLTKEREQEAMNLARQLREVRHIIEAKETRKAQLEAETATQIQDVAAAKDEEIRHMVQQIHQERDMILNDIQDVRVVNREQAFNLRRGQVQKDRGNTVVFAPPKSAKLRTPTRTDALSTVPVRATTRQAQFRQEVKPSEGEIALTKANEELEVERSELNTRLHRAGSDKSDLLKSIKVAKENSKKETEHRRQLLRELEMQALASRRKAAQLEDENFKLEETCEALAGTLKSTKTQYENLGESRETLAIDFPVTAS